MKSFKNKLTGVVLTPKNKWVEEQLEANRSFVVLDDKASNASTEKAIKDYTKNELVAYLTNLGIDCNEGMKKEELLSLIPEE